MKSSKGFDKRSWTSVIHSLGIAPHLNVPVGCEQPTTTPAVFSVLNVSIMCALDAGTSGTVISLHVNKTWKTSTKGGLQETEGRSSFARCAGLKLKRQKAATI